MTALDLFYVSDGLAEVERALAAGQYKLALDLATFLWERTGATIGLDRVHEARTKERAA